MADTRTWTCDRCGLTFPSTRKTRGGILPSRCEDCKHAADRGRDRSAVPRSNTEIAYVMARECTELRAAMMLALRALTTGRYIEARAALESVLGPPVW